MGPVLIAEGVSKEYPTRSGALSVLRGASLALEADTSAAIMGPSGCGKSTFLNILGTLEPPTAGRVTIAGRDPFTLGETQLASFRNRNIGFVFQEHHLLAPCTVLENVLIPTLAGEPDAEAPARARALLDRVGLADRLDHLPAELSGGERQRVAVARALINKPAIVLADEPTGNLDQHSAEAVVALLLELNREQGAVLIVVTHSAGVAKKMDKQFSLTDGVLVAS
jgi:lipoprotein-releasing system ATP-binding protein